MVTHHIVHHKLDQTANLHVKMTKFTGPTNINANRFSATYLNSAKSVKTKWGLDQKRLGGNLLERFQPAMVNPVIARIGFRSNLVLSGLCHCQSSFNYGCYSDLLTWWSGQTLVLSATPLVCPAVRLHSDISVPKKLENSDTQAMRLMCHTKSTVRHCS